MQTAQWVGVKSSRRVPIELYFKLKVLGKHDAANPTLIGSLYTKWWSAKVTVLGRKYQTLT